MATQNLVAKYQKDKNDTGSTAVQIALLSDRILELTGHLNQHKQDVDSRSGLLKMVGRRRRLLNYLASTEPETYQQLVKDLSLRK